jgi:hypothetical protein
MLEFMIDPIFVMLGGRTNYEADFIHGLLKVKEKNLA